MGSLCGFVVEKEPCCRFHYICAFIGEVFFAKRVPSYALPCINEPTINVFSGSFRHSCKVIPYAGRGVGIVNVFQKPVIRWFDIGWKGGSDQGFGQVWD